MARIDEKETTDEVLQEVRAIKEQLAAAMNFDVKRILDDARRRQQAAASQTPPHQE